MRDLQRVEDDGRQVALRLGGARQICEAALLKDAAERLSGGRPGAALLLKAEVCKLRETMLNTVRNDNAYTYRHGSQIQL